MLDYIDNFLNRITMYRLVLYGLAFLWIIALVFSLIGILQFSPLSLIVSLAFITSVSWMTNTAFGKAYRVPTNVESVYITAFILALIVNPVGPSGGIGYLIFLAFVSIWSMASKFIIAIRKKHLFNPAALAVAVSAFTIGQSATWWIGNAFMAPFVLIVGFLILRKTKRFDLAMSFLAISLAVIVGSGFLRGASFWTIIQRAVLQSPLLFFASVMLTEPLTTPPTKTLRILYGILTGLLFIPSVHLGSFYTTPELALLIGNVFVYLVSPKKKLILKLKQRLMVAPDTYDFIFVPDQDMGFKPGQYMEWTLGHQDPDSRGNRRYFTIASSPTEKDLRLGVKFYPNPSSFKRRLLSMNIGDTVIASQLSGDFVLPKNKKKKLVFIAGGIGITPFRSIVKYLIDHDETRDATLFYSNGKLSEIVYKDIFDKAKDRLGIKTVYTLTKTEEIPDPWTGRTGRINGQMIMEEVPDYKERIFYLSGPHAMVTAFEDVLENLGVSKSQIKTDYFPGFA